MPMIKANYIKQFRDSINKEGIAFYSYDKRTANKNNVAFMIKTVLILKILLMMFKKL